MSFPSYYFNDLNYPIYCPSCSKEFLPINSMNYNSNNLDFIINYICSNSTNKNLKKISLKKLLLQYCPYHLYEPAPFICAECDNFLCKECYLEHILFYEEGEINSKFENINNRKCLKHNLNFINYCDKCKNFVCKLCIENYHLNHINKWVYLNKSYNDLNKDINLKIKTIKDNVDNNIKKINDIISKAQNIKDMILNSYNNYLNVYLPLINIYKILLYNSKDPKNNFNLKEIINESNTKIDKEISQIKINLSNIIKNINYIFSKMNFKYENNQISKITTDNPFKINKNSKQHFTHLIKTLKNHNGAIYKIIKLTSGKFASCSADGTIIIWDDYLMEMNVKIQAHKLSVNSICEIENNILISCSNDKSIKLWDMNDDYKLIKTIIINQPVISIFKLKDGFFSSFAGNKIDIYSNKKYECIFTKIISDVSFLCYINNNIFAASKDDCSIEIFNVFNNNETFLLKEIDDLASTITPINNNKLICGYYEGDIIVWDIENKKIEIQIKKAHEYNINVIILLNNKNIASASNDKKIKIWDLYNKQLITCFVNAHSMSIRAMIQINNGNIVSGGSDEEIKIWG